MVSEERGDEDVEGEGQGEDGEGEGEDVRVQVAEDEAEEGEFVNRRRGRGIRAEDPGWEATVDHDARRVPAEPAPPPLVDRRPPTREDIGCRIHVARKGQQVAAE